jgi:hypothetical protein
MYEGWVVLVWTKKQIKKKRRQQQLAAQSRLREIKTTASSREEGRKEEIKAVDCEEDALNQ